VRYGDLSHLKRDATAMAHNLRAECYEVLLSSTASRTVVAGDFRWQDRLAAWALIQGFDEREREAFSDCRY